MLMIHCNLPVDFFSFPDRCCVQVSPLNNVLDQLLQIAAVLHKAPLRSVLSFAILMNFLRLVNN